MIQGIPSEKKVVLFDGVCNLCNTSVQKIIQFDKKENFVFASIQSEIGQEIISSLNIDTNKTDSIILFSSDKQFTIKSSAILQIANTFGGFWNITQVFWIIPKLIRDLCYDFIAKNRYIWFGKQDNCIIPTPELQQRFLS